MVLTARQRPTGLTPRWVGPDENQSGPVSLRSGQEHPVNTVEGQGPALELNRSRNRLKLTARLNSSNRVPSVTGDGDEGSDRSPSPDYFLTSFRQPLPPVLLLPRTQGTPGQRLAPRRGRRRLNRIPGVDRGRLRQIGSGIRSLSDRARTKPLAAWSKSNPTVSPSPSLLYTLPTALLLPSKSSFSQPQT